MCLCILLQIQARESGGRALGPDETMAALRTDYQRSKDAAAAAAAKVGC